VNLITLTAGEFISSTPNIGTQKMNRIRLLYKRPLNQIERKHHSGHITNVE